jgi:serine/threonine protein kinase
MAPEQWRGKPCEATDQYALGVVLYELLTGKKPYTADTPAALVVLQATEPLPAPTSFVMEIPRAAEKFLYKALAKDPGDRYENMLAFKTALEEMPLLATASITPVGDYESEGHPQETQTMTPETTDNYETVDALDEASITPVGVPEPDGEPQGTQTITHFETDNYETVDDLGTPSITPVGAPESDLYPKETQTKTPDSSDAYETIDDLGEGDPEEGVESWVEESPDIIHEEEVGYTKKSPPEPLPEQQLIPERQQDVHSRKETVDEIGQPPEKDSLYKKFESHTAKFEDRILNPPKWLIWVIGVILILFFIFWLLGGMRCAPPPL